MTTVRTVPLDEPVPLLDHRPNLVWLAPRRALVGFGEALRLTPPPGPERMRSVARTFEDWCETLDTEDAVGVPGTGPIAFVSFTFDERTGGSVLVVPEVVLGSVDGAAFLTTIGDVDPGPYLHPSGTGEDPVDRPRYAGASIPDVAWLEAVAETIAAIEAGEVEKVVLARDYAVWSKVRFDPRRVLRNLSERFPQCFTFAVGGLVGASPELLCRRMGETVESVVLAGSAPRDSDRERDRKLGADLLRSDKDLREHRMAADSVAEALDPICERLAGDASPTLHRLANVQHLATRFRGTLHHPLGLLEIVSLLHPTAAVGGTPRDRAMDLIRTLEGMERGRYAGPVGWLDAGGDGEMAIALRCAELSGARARLFAGAGIVEGSLPENELEETRLKLQAMLEALA